MEVAGCNVHELRIDRDIAILDSLAGACPCEAGAIRAVGVVIGEGGWLLNIGGVTIHCILARGPTQKVIEKLDLIIEPLGVDSGTLAAAEVADDSIVHQDRPRSPNGTPK